LHSDVLRETLLTVLETTSVVIGTTLNLVDETDPASVTDGEETEAWMEGYLGENNGANEPLSAFYYPIVKNAKKSVTMSEGSPLLGVIAMTISWRHIIENILPKGWHDIHVVFVNDCNQSFTYRVDGPNVVYKGPSDLHDSKFDHMEVRTKNHGKIRFHLMQSLTHFSLTAWFKVY
jgi:hypothetical protein